MDLWRRAANPWGQDVLIGVSWDLMWSAVIAAVAFQELKAVFLEFAGRFGPDPPDPTHSTWFRAHHPAMPTVRSTGWYSYVALVAGNLLPAFNDR